MAILRSPATAVPENALAGQIRVYPNPAREMVWIDLSSFNGRVQRIEMMNATGQQVMQPVSNPVQKIQKLDLESLPGGIYFVRLSTDKGIFTKKIIIKD